MLWSIRRGIIFFVFGIFFETGFDMENNRRMEILSCR